MPSTDVLKEQLDSIKAEREQALIQLNRCDGAITVLTHLIKLDEAPASTDKE